MIVFEDIEVVLGDDIEMVFSVIDKAGDAVPLSGAGATFSIAKKGSFTPLIELSNEDSSESIVFDDSDATVTFNSDSLLCAGNYFAQLRITKSGKSQVAAQGNIKVLPLIAE